MTVKEKVIMALKPFLYILPGMFLVLNPKTSVFSICYIMGALGLAFGIMKIVSYFRQGEDTPFRVFSLFVGIAFSIFGFVCIAFPSAVASIIPFMFGIILVFDSIIKLQHSLFVKRNGIKTWWVGLLVSALIFFAGLFLIFNAFNFVTVTVRLFGIFLIIDGVFDIGKATYFLLSNRKE